MILYTGKDSVIRGYLVAELGLDGELLLNYPSSDTHYSDFGEELSIIEYYKDDFISQNKEFIDYLLESDLDFDIHTIYWDDEGGFFVRRLSKEKAKDLRFHMGLELR